MQGELESYGYSKEEFAWVNFRASRR